MMVLCGGALVVGIAASLAIPFVPFAVALLLAIIVAAVWAGWHGMGSVEVLLSGVAILVSTQVGYGIGLIGAAGFGGTRRALRRPAAAKSAPPALSDLHLGEKP